MNNMSLPLWVWIRNIVHDWKYTDYKGEKFHALYSVKKVMLTVFKDMKGPITIDFLEKMVAIDRASYC